MVRFLLAHRVENSKIIQDDARRVIHNNMARYIVNVLFSGVAFFVFFAIFCVVSNRNFYTYALSYVFVNDDPAESRPHCSKLHKE